jgi:hypothetical protein
MKTTADTTYTFTFTKDELKLLITLAECADVGDHADVDRFSIELFKVCESYLWEGDEQ